MLLLKAAILLSSLSIITSSSPRRNQIRNGPLPTAGPYLSAVFGNDQAELLYAEQMIPTAGDGEFVYYGTFDFSIGKRGAYAGLLHATGTDHSPEGVPLVYSNKFSISDVKTNENATVPPEAKLVYGCPGLMSEKFGNEGTGLHTGHPMPWSRDTWYATAVRRWYKPNDTVTYIANFMYDFGTGNWTHYSTISVPEVNAYILPLRDGSNSHTAFLEAYLGEPVGYHGIWRRHHRMLDRYLWEGPLYYSASAGGPPKFWNAKRVGWNTVKVIAGGEFPNDQEVKNFTMGIEGVPEITMPAPVVKDLNFEVIKSLEPFSLKVTWEVDVKAPPQLSYKLKVFDDEHVLVAEKKDTVPHCREVRFDLPKDIIVKKGQIELRIVNIFDDPSGVLKISWNTPNVV